MWLRSSAFATVVALFAGETNGALLWGSTGGGWRSMFADIGYANLFHQAGLFDATGSKFDAIATTSGASWFNAQLFYSQAFYEQAVLAQTPEELEKFSLAWMESYRQMSSDIEVSSAEKCAPLKVLGDDFVYQACGLVMDHNGTWASMMDEMFERSGAMIGDPGFHQRINNPENRIDALQQTDFLAQTALMPNSRYFDDVAQRDVFLGYQSEGDPDPNLFTVALAAAYVVSDDKAEFIYSTGDVESEIQTYVAPAHDEYDEKDWKYFYLHKPGEGGTVTIKGSVLGIDESSSSGTFATPFGGQDKTTVVQVAATSSAAGGFPTPAMPSEWAQYMTSMVDGTLENKKPVWVKALLGIVAGLAMYYLVEYLKSSSSKKGDYESVPNGDSGSGKHGNPLTCLYDCCLDLWICNSICCCLCVGGLVFTFYSFGSILIPSIVEAGSDYLFAEGGDVLDALSVCSQWPNSCGPNDGQFSDGIFTDAPALALNVGHHMKKNGIDTETPLKIILTNTNRMLSFEKSDISDSSSTWNDPYELDQIIHNFQTDYNKDVAPGDFVWTPGANTPFRSPQIFDTYVSYEEMRYPETTVLKPITGSNMTTATFSTTTIDNPAFGVQAGQPVELLLLNLNTAMTTMVIGLTAIDENTQGLADMTNHVAFNKELLNRVRDFVAE